MHVLSHWIIPHSFRLGVILFSLFARLPPVADRLKLDALAIAMGGLLETSSSGASVSRAGLPALSAPHYSLGRAERSKAA
jgi:hypothetical protein